MIPQPMTNNERLLMPRYLVIADYPNSFLRIGDILNMIPKDFELWENQRDLIKFMDAPSRYPAIFKPLHWAEHRKPEDMPEYVFNTNRNEYAKVERFDFETTSAFFMYVEGDRVPFSPKAWLPATLEEYTEYQSLKTK